jgi:hypothetical protein
VCEPYGVVNANVTSPGGCRSRAPDAMILVVTIPKDAEMAGSERDAGYALAGV